MAVLPHHKGTINSDGFPLIALNDAQLIADQVLFIGAGRIALQGTPTILQQSDHPGLLRYLGQ
ncbi:hypothetical protein [Aeromonas sp. FDAARGOS 1407]|uniref:hypothetical protein n=1 Tax=Aeromonas enteropelogenes TaxID=29489 RepID=UPI001C247A9A|nr:hypothetical protein I6L37_00760 [Aeromonas sp. FDAARGOS 1407]